MSSEVKNFIDKLSAGKNAEAGDSFKDKRQDVAGNMFNAQAFSSPKPDIATPGQFNQDGTITNVDGTPGESGPELAAATAPEVAEPVATEAPADAPEVSLDNVGA